MGASNWYLFFGAIFCCTGIGLPVGIFMIVYWFYKDFMDRGVTVKNVQMSKDEYNMQNEDIRFGGDDGKDQTFKGRFGLDKPDGNYKFKGNITDLKDKEKYI